MLRQRCQARGNQAQRAATALAIALTTVWIAAPCAWAALGQSVESVAEDQRQMRGTLRSSQGQGFQMQEIASEDGNTVRQYVSPAGTVFGVSWTGPTVPDLALLLGPYFDEFRAAAYSPVRRHHPVTLRTEHLVIQTGGHVRALRGRVYLPSLVPASVAAGLIQ